MRMLGGVRSMVRRIFPIFHNFRMYVGRSPLEVSWTHPRGDDNHDVKGLDHRIQGNRISGGYAHWSMM